MQLFCCSVGDTDDPLSILAEDDRLGIKNVYSGGWKYPVPNNHDGKLTPGDGRCLAVLSGGGLSALTLRNTPHK